MPEIVPFRKRFRFQFERKGERFYFHLLLGIAVLYVSRRWGYWDGSPQFSEVAIGWIPWRIREGGVLPCWKPYYREYPEQQTEWNGGTNA
jgi:hypothetical protein